MATGILPREFSFETKAMAETQTTAETKTMVGLKSTTFLLNRLGLLCGVGHTCDVYVHCTRARVSDIFNQHFSVVHRTRNTCRTP